MTLMNELSTAEPGTLIKSDRIGRSHYSENFKAQVLAAFEGSSLSGQAFAEQCGIKYPTFASWRAKAKRSLQEQSVEGSMAMPFVIAELGVNTQSHAQGLTVTLPNGASAIAHDERSIKLLASLLKALG